MVGVVVLVAGALAWTSRRPTAVDNAAVAKLTAETAERDPSLQRRVAVNTNRIGCVVDVFGTEPAQISTTEQVRVVYATLFCAGVTPDGTLAGAETLVTPAAVTVGASPAVVTPAEGGNWTAATRRIIPERWWGKAERGPANPEALKEQLSARVADLARPPG